MQATLQQVVEGQRPCIRCGYMLEGLPTGGRCPECGTPVARSLMGDLLVYSDPTYLGLLRRGAATVLISVVLLMAVIIAAVVIKASNPRAVFLTPYFYIGVHAVFVLGWVWFTVPDPGQLTTNKGERPRRFVRGCLAGLIGVKLCAVALPVVVSLPPHLTTAVRGLDSVLLALGLIAGMRYLVWLSPRLPDHGVFRDAGRLTSYLWVAAGCGAVTTAASVVRGAVQGATLTPGTARLVDILTGLGLGLVRVVGAIVTLLAFIQFCALFTRLRSRLARVSEEQGLRLGCEV